MLATIYVNAISGRLINSLSCSSHIGFLRKYVKHLKDIKFLREDLVFSIHSEEVIWRGTILAYLDWSACYTVDNRILNEYAKISSSDQEIYNSRTYYAPL